MSTKTSPLPSLDVAQRYSIEEAIRYLRSSRASVYRDIREGRLRVIKERKRTFVPGSEIARRSLVPDCTKADSGRQLSPSSDSKSAAR
jgi:Helix-turn-helix domain